jgi:guanylate kinase
MRSGEVQGDIYDFVSDERFEELKQQHDFIEYALVHQQYYYGTRKSLVQSAFAAGKNVLKQVDIHGWEDIVEQDDVRQYSRSVFMDVSDETMRERITQRDSTTSEEDIQHRLESARYERLKAEELCDVVIDVDGMTPENQLDVVREIIRELLE